MERMIGNELRDVQQLLNQKIERERPVEDKTSPIQMRTLTFIYDQKVDVFQRDIEKELHIRRSTATEILKRLERDGYITRCPVASDARLKKIILTDLSLSLISKMRSHIDRTEAKLRQDISKEDLAVFFTVMDQIQKNLE